MGKKLNLTQEKYAFTNQKKYAAAAEEIYCNTKINAKQLKPGLVAFYIRHLAWKRSGSILKGKDK